MRFPHRKVIRAQGDYLVDRRQAYGRRRPQPSLTNSPKGVQRGFPSPATPSVPEEEEGPRGPLPRPKKTDAVPQDLFLPYFPRMGKTKFFPPIRPGAYYAPAIPVPIPNTAVKRRSAHGTAGIPVEESVSAGTEGRREKSYR